MALFDLEAVDYLMRTRAIGYIQVNNNAQAIDGVSFDAQLDMILAYVNLNDFDLVNVFFDIGEFASVAECFGLQQSFAILDSGEASALVVYKLDYLSLNVLDVLHLISEIVGYGASLHSIVEGLDTQSGLDKFFVNITSALNELERSCVSNRTIHAMASKKKLGHHCGSPAYGYQVVDKKLLRNPAESSVIALISSMKADGATLQMIADELNLQGITTKRNSKWQPTQVSRVLAGQRK